MIDSVYVFTVYSIDFFKIKYKTMNSFNIFKAYTNLRYMEGRKFFESLLKERKTCLPKRKTRFKLSFFNCVQISDTIFKNVSILDKRSFTKEQT